MLSDVGPPSPVRVGSTPAMRASLEDRFPEELAILSRLFGEVYLRARLPRLDTISEYTEQKWLEYVDRIPRRYVKYLLILEAPPGTDDDPPLYFLDPACRPRTLMNAVSPAFFGCQSADGKRTLDGLAQRGFLMVDSIPFSMKYTSSLRSRPAYSQLVGRTAKSYMLDKLTSSSLSWSDDLRIGFSLRLNANCVMAALQHTLPVGSREFHLSDAMVVTDASNYPKETLNKHCF
jgi:hypothetical protein